MGTARNRSFLVEIPFNLYAEGALAFKPGETNICWRGQSAVDIAALTPWGPGDEINGRAP